MELQTISQISKLFNISTRTLRYYEQIGLIQPIKRNDFAYRTYDKSAVVRLQQIIILRKLRISLKQIADILMCDDSVVAINTFKQNLIEIEDELTALSTIKSVIQSLLESLYLQNDALRLLDDESLLEIVHSLTASKINFKEDKTMEDLNKANERLNKLTDKDVRIVYLPPSAIASCQYEGDDPERYVGQIINKFVQENELTRIKPDLRNYGFNAPNPKDDTGVHGYEMWVTIPDNFDVPAPLVKKYFNGGLYCAHMIPIGAFDEWALLSKWLDDSDKYEYRGNGSPNNMFDSLEECLNYVNVDHSDWAKWDNVQLDLLIPIKERTK